MGEDLVGKVKELKGSIQTLWDEITKNDFELARRKIQDVSNKVQNKFRGHEVIQSDQEEDLDYEHNYADDLPLTLNRESRPGIRYYATENSPFAVGAEKVEAAGIDSFGEEDTFDPDEADDHQSLRDRHQNSDLTSRFYSPGMDLGKSIS